MGCHAARDEERTRGTTDVDGRSDLYSAVTAAIGALRGPKHGGANEFAFEIQNRYADPDQAEADVRRRVANKEVIIGFGHPVYTIADPRNEVIKRVGKHQSLEFVELNIRNEAGVVEIVTKCIF